MKNYLYRFTALALVPALVLADPAWASGAWQHLFSATNLSQENRFLAQAITPPSIVPGPGRGGRGNLSEPNERRRFLMGTIGIAVTLGATVAAPALAPLTAFAQKPDKKVQQETRKQIVIRVAEMKKDTVPLSPEKLKEAITFPFNIQDANHSENLLGMILRQNPAKGENVAKYLEAWLNLIGLVESDRRYGLNSDIHHGLGPKVGKGKPSLVRDGV